MNACIFRDSYTKSSSWLPVPLVMTVGGSLRMLAGIPVNRLNGILFNVANAYLSDSCVTFVL